MQVRVIRDALDGVVAATSDNQVAAGDAETAYLFREGRLLVRRDRVEEVIAHFQDRADTYHEEAELLDEPIPGMVRVAVPRRRDGRDSVLATLDDLEGDVRPDADGRPAATPDHVMYVTAYGKLCPATEPDLPTSDRPVPSFAVGGTGGAGIRVSVVDTGLWEPATINRQTPWLHHGVVADPKDQEVINQKAIHEYGGHGTFVAGVIKQAAPAAHIQVQGALTHGGAVYESEIVEQLHEAYQEQDHPQLISISAGTHTRKDFALISFDALMDAMRQDGIDPLVIAAAGNDGSSKPFWPAAFPWVIGVGAVDSNGKVADYSNYGPWVDVYALGTDHVNAFPIGTYTCYEPANAGQVRVFDGMAQWSGTSFATPVVTGLVAAQMDPNNPDAVGTCAALIKGGTKNTDPDGKPIMVVGPLS